MLGVVLFIALPQEVRVRIRSVNAHVAERAFLKLGVQEVMAACLKVDAGIARARAALVVALQADGKYHRPREQLRIHGSMRAMAGLAAFDSYRGVLVYERSALIHMALQTRDLDIERALHHPRPLAHAPRGSGGAVRIMAIAALHETFIHAVVRGHFELCTYVGVAGVACLILAFRQQVLGRRRMVNRVASRADHAVERVLGALDVGLIEVTRMAGEAGFHHGLGRHQ